MNLNELKRSSPSKLKALFGLSEEALAELLLDSLPIIMERRRQGQERRPGRRRAVGGGRRRILYPFQEVLLTLVYLRHNVTHAVVGHMFGVSADTSENVFHDTVRLLAEICPSDRWDAEKHWKKGQSSWMPSDEDLLIVDSFETPIRRPSLLEAQKRTYSGKKKQNTLKTQVVTNGKGKIICIDPGHRGPTSDKRLYDESDVPHRFPDIPKQGDLAYKGAKGVQTPHRKPPKRSLTDEQKEQNRVLSSSRVHVEHGIRRIKAFRIVRQDYRLAPGLFPKIASAVVGLVQLQSITG